MHDLGTVTWNKIGLDFLQKISISKSGIISYGYHYKIKLSKPCKTFVIDTAASRELSMFCLIEKDIRDALSFADKYQNILDNKKNTEINILLNALFIATVINYGRCFKKSKARHKLIADDAISDKNKDAHSELIRIRDKYVAHADYTDYESCKCILVLTQEMKFKKNGNASMQTLIELEKGHPFEFSKNFKSPIIDAHEWVNKKINSLLQVVGEPFNDKEILEKLYKYAKNKEGRIILNDQILKKLNGS